MKKLNRWMLLLPILFLAASFKLIYAGKPPIPAKTTTAEKINFVENDWNAAVKKASAQKKWIFVDCYATWCGPCKMLKIQTFSNNKVAAFFNDKFVNVSIDMEKGQGPQLAELWKIQAYPTLIIFDENAKPVLGTMGFMKADELMRFAQEALAKK